MDFHPAAIPSAQAAECARDLYEGDEAYFKMHDKIFEEQAKKGQGTIQYTTDEIKQWARDIGYDKVSGCMDEGKFISEIQKDLADGQAAGVRGTPGFLVLKGDSGQGTLISGAQPFSAFDAAFKALGA